MASLGEHVAARLLLPKFPIFYSPPQADEKEGTDWIIGLDDNNPPQNFLRLQVKVFKFSGPSLRYLPLESNTDQQRILKFAETNDQNMRASIHNLKNSTKPTEKAGVLALNRVAFIEENGDFDPILGIPNNTRLSGDLIADIEQQLYR